VAARVTGADLGALHRRLVEGDPTASEEAARLLLEPLTSVTQRAFPRLDAQVIADAVVDALLEYFVGPERAQERGVEHIQAYLQRAAWRNAANQYRGSKRRKFREQNWLQQSDVPDVEVSSPLGTLIEEEDAQAQSAKEASLMSLLPDDSDRLILRLRLAGERSTEAFARALGVDNLTIHEQRKLVKQAKDRIDKFLRRHGSKTK